jgi:hypothetical protein
MTAGKDKEQAAVVERQGGVVSFDLSFERHLPRLRESSHNDLAYPGWGPYNQ